MNSTSSRVNVPRSSSLDALDLEDPDNLTARADGDSTSSPTEALFEPLDDAGAAGDELDAVADEGLPTVVGARHASPLQDVERRLTPGAIAALAEVVICSGAPTQLTIMALMSAGGLPLLDGEGSISLLSLTVLSLADTVLLVGLVLALLRSRGERPTELLFGARPAVGEGILGIALTPVVFACAIAVMGSLRVIAPWLHNEAENPFQALIGSAGDTVVLAIVVMIAGGVREEVQRAFVLHRFEQSLGGAAIGLVVFSAVFGLWHVVQGWDAAVTTASLGALWGLMYLRRRSIIAASVSHAGFNLTEVVVAYLFRPGA